MEKYIEETLKFLTSKDMQSHLRSHPEWLCRATCTAIVAKAPAPLEEKQRVFNLIAQQTEKPSIEGEPYTEGWFNPETHARSVQIALDERYDDIPGMMYWLQDHHIDEKSKLNGYFFTNYDSAADCIQERITDEIMTPDYSQYLHYTITKYIPDDDEFIEVCTWTLNFSGEIWYFYYDSFDLATPDGWEDELLDYDSLFPLDLPTPFQPGDTILVDCRPFAKEKHIVLKKPFKHTKIFNESNENPRISVFYRTEKLSD